MTVRVMEGKNPYVGGKAIDIEDKKIINLCLRDENNLIIYDEGDDEIYVDLQLDSDIESTDVLPVGITTGRISTSNGWEYTGTLLNCKTTSGDLIQIIYTDNGKLYVDNGSGTFKEFLFQGDIDGLRTYIDTELAKKQDVLTAGENITIVEDPQTGELVISSTGGGGATYTAGNGIGISNDVISLDNVITASPAPSTAPSYVGQICIANGDEIYMATGTSSATDWKQIFAGGPFTIEFLNYDSSVLQTKVVSKGVIPEYTGATPTKPYDVGYGIFDGFGTITPATANKSYTAEFHGSCQGPCPTGYHVQSRTEASDFAYLLDEIFGDGSSIDLNAVNTYIGMKVDYGTIYWSRDVDSDDCSGAGGWVYDIRDNRVRPEYMYYFGYIRPICDDQSYDPSSCTEVFSNGGCKVLYDGNDYILVGACSYLKIAREDLSGWYQRGNNHMFTASEKSDSSLAFSDQKDVSGVLPSTYSDGHWFDGSGATYVFRMITSGDWYTLWGGVIYDN